MEKDLVEKLQQSSVQLLEFVEQSGKDTANFAKEQVPLVIQEVLNWGFYSHIAYGLIQFLVSIALLIIVKKIWNWSWKEDPSGDQMAFVAPAIVSLPAIMSFCSAVHNFLIVLKITVAPRLYLIEQLKVLIGKN